MEDRLKPYPSAANGMKRLIIVLPGRGNEDPHSGPITGEDSMEVELIAGKTVMTDGVNLTKLMGVSITEKTVKGWGYPYWEVGGSTDKMISTLVGVAPGASQVESFVTGKSEKIRYNSRLPVVVYAPSDMEVRWRVWRADKEASVANEG